MVHYIDAEGVLLLSFLTQHGYDYFIEESTDLEVWMRTPEMEFHGSGTEMSIPWGQASVSPPAGTAPPPPPPIPHDSFTVQALLGMGKSLVSWVSEGTIYRRMVDLSFNQPNLAMFWSGQINAGTPEVYALDLVIVNILPDSAPLYPLTAYLPWEQDQALARLTAAYSQILANPTPQLGSSGAVTSPPPEGASERKFVRLVVSHADTDGDLLADWWELAHGYNPLVADTDGDGHGDAAEDGDADGTANFAEANALMEDPEDFVDALRADVPGWIRITRSADTEFTRYYPYEMIDLTTYHPSWLTLTQEQIQEILSAPALPGYGYSSWGASYDYVLGGVEYLSTKFPATGLPDLIATMPGKVRPEPWMVPGHHDGIDVGLAVAGVSRRDNMEESYAYVDEDQCWLAAARPSVEDREFTFYKITRQETNETLTDVQVEPLTITIPAGEYFSSSYSFVNTAADPPTPSRYEVFQNLRQTTVGTPRIDVDANMDELLGVVSKSSNGTISLPDDIEYEFTPGLMTPLSQSAASVIVPLENVGKTSQPQGPIYPSNLILDDVHEVALLNRNSRSQLKLALPGLKAMNYTLHPMLNAEHRVRLFYDHGFIEQASPFFHEGNTTPSLDPLKIRENSSIDVKVQGFSAGPAVLELRGTTKAGANPVARIFDRVHLNVNCFQLWFPGKDDPDPDKTQAFKLMPLTWLPHRHRVGWRKDLNAATIAELNESQSYLYPGVPARLPVVAGDSFGALSGTLTLQLPALRKQSYNPQNSNLWHPTATWDTKSKAPHDETASYWVGMKDSTGADKFWIQWGFLIKREANDDYDEQKAWLYLEGGSEGTLDGRAEGRIVTEADRWYGCRKSSGA